MRHRSCVLAAALMVGVATPVASEAERGQPNGQPAVAEEIIVTARKRDERLIETPLSVTALSASDLTRRQVDDLGGLRDIVPNLSVNMGDAANAIVYIRGVGQRDSLSFADPGVGIYLDDVYLGRAQGAFLEVIDIERIEAARTAGYVVRSQHHRRRHQVRVGRAVARARVRCRGGSWRLLSAGREGHSERPLGIG